MSEAKIKELSQEAYVLLDGLNKGFLDINRLKGFLSNVGALGYPNKKKPKVNKYDHMR